MWLCYLYCLFDEIKFYIHCRLLSTVVDRVVNRCRLLSIVLSVVVDRVVNRCRLLSIVVDRDVDRCRSLC